MPAPARRRVLRYPSLAHRDSNNVVQEIDAARGLATEGLSADLVSVEESGNITENVQVSLEALDQAKVNSLSLGSFAYLNADGDTTVVVYGDGTQGKVGAGQLADTAVTPGAYTSANITVDQQGRITLAASGSAGTGLTLTNDANASVTVGDAISGTHRRLTHATPALTLDAQATVATIVAATPAGGASASVAVEAGATYFSKGGDQSGAGATTGFNIKGFTVFECVANGDGNSAKWFVAGDTDLAETADGNLTVQGNLVVVGTVTVPDASLAIADTSGLQAALDAKAPLASPTFTGTATADNVTATGTVDFGDAGIEVPNGSAVSGALTKAAHGGGVYKLSGNVTITAAAGFCVTLLSDGARTVGAGGTAHTTAAGDVVSVVCFSASNGDVKLFETEAANVVNLPTS